MGWRGGERSGRFSCVERIGWMEGRWWIIREGGWSWNLFRDGKEDGGMRKWE